MTEPTIIPIGASEDGARGGFDSIDEREPMANPADTPEPANSASDYEERWVRATADLANIRKRRGKEVHAARREEREGLLRDFAGVIDNLDRALETDEQSGAGWKEGLDAVRRQMMDLMKINGAEPIEALGHPFDPTRHEAVAVVGSPEFDDGTVVQVTRAGFQDAEGRVIRPSGVIVVKNEA